MNEPRVLPRLLERTARSRPSHVAIEDAERDVEISYGDLAARSDEVRDALARGGVRPGDRVGIYAPKSVATLASILGTLKAGAVYVPVDPSAPPARNALIFEDCGVQAIVVAKDLVEGLAAAFKGPRFDGLEDLRSLDEFGVRLVLMSGGETRAEPPTSSAGDAAASPDSVAYILYTSGSTGRPKGVTHTHSSALSFVDWCSEVFEPDEHDRFSSHAPLHFDLSILDIYVPLKHGATLVLIGEELGKQPARLGSVISDRRLSVWYSTPSILRLLVEYGRMEHYDYSALRLVLFAGEVFPVKHLRALKSVWPEPRYFNLYGPTETNVCTYYEVPSEIPEDRTEPFPIGKTCSNDRSKVVDERAREVPFGEEGELYVSGGSVMRGYWNLPERSAEAFSVDDSGVPWYRTGDVVKEGSDGNYIFVGRRDRMVKRRGYRVELGEIEAALYRHHAVAEAAVIASPDEENGVLIKAFLSLAGAERPSLIELKRFCAENLPLYMIPDRFSFPDSLPKTSTDKVDYQRLKELD